MLCQQLASPRGVCAVKQAQRLAEAQSKKKASSPEGMTGRLRSHTPGRFCTAGTAPVMGGHARAQRGAAHLAGNALDLLDGQLAGVAAQLGQLLVVPARVEGRSKAPHAPAVRQLRIRRLQLCRCITSVSRWLFISYRVWV